MITIATRLSLVVRRQQAFLRPRMKETPRRFGSPPQQHLVRCDRHGQRDGFVPRVERRVLIEDWEGQDHPPDAKHGLQKLKVKDFQGSR